MSVRPHPASAEECAGIWPAVKADRLMDSAEELLAYHSAAPWRVRVTARGEATLLGPWRSRLGVLAIRGAWCAERHVTAFARDAAEVAGEQGFSEVLSPLLPRELLGGYERSGMTVFASIIAIQGLPAEIRPARTPAGVTLRTGSTADAQRVAALDEECFDEFWRYGEADIADLVRTERLTVAETSDGELIGYTLATASRGAATLGRLCTAPAARRRGVARALLADAAAWSASQGARTISLCTQEENLVSRSLYAAAGLREIDVPYALAARQVQTPLTGR